MVVSCFSDPPKLNLSCLRKLDVPYDPCLGSTPTSDSWQFKMPVYDSQNVKIPNEIEIECWIRPCKQDGTDLPNDVWVSTVSWFY